MPSIFIDGEAGTTGLGIRDRLKGEPGVTLLSLADADRKDPRMRQAMMAEADLVILCLPDEAAKESVSLADALGAQSPRVLDASTAHRVAPGWVYGFPELAAGQAAAIAAARRVANVGCYAVGAIALVRPLVDAGLIPADVPLTINAVSGYSGGGKSMIADYEGGRGPAFDLYALTLAHKHVPEIMAFGGLTRRPLFVPSVGNYRQGMLVSIPLHLAELAGKPEAADLEAALAAHYRGRGSVRVLPAMGEGPRADRLEPEALNGTDVLELRVYRNDSHGHAVLVSRLDNLGKGASGQAVQCARLMLGLPRA